MIARHAQRCAAQMRNVPVDHTKTAVITYKYISERGTNQERDSSSRNMFSTKCSPLPDGFSYILQVLLRPLVARDSGRPGNSQLPCFGYSRLGLLGPALDTGSSLSLVVTVFAVRLG